MKASFDSSVWIDHLRGGRDLSDLVASMRGRCVLQVDAVVAGELRAGAVGRIAARVVESLLDPFRKSGRLLVPVEGDYQRAAEALARLRARGLSLAHPQGALLDGLIASVAARTGAVLVTRNLRDFERLAKEIPCRVERLEEFAARFADG